MCNQIEKIKSKKGFIVLKKFNQEWSVSKEGNDETVIIKDVERNKRSRVGKLEDHERLIWDKGERKKCQIFSTVRCHFKQTS